MLQVSVSYSCEFSMRRGPLCRVRGYALKPLSDILLSNFSCEKWSVKNSHVNLFRAMGRGPTWSQSEDDELCCLVRAYGCHWSVIARSGSLSRRSAPSLRARWNALLPAPLWWMATRRTSAHSSIIIFDDGNLHRTSGGSSPRTCRLWRRGPRLARKVVYG